MKRKPVRLAIPFLGIFLCIVSIFAPRLQAGPRSFELLPTGGDGPHLFAEGVISTPGDEAGGVFSPDGNEFYFARLNPATTGSRIGLLCVSHWREGKWTTPEALPFSGKDLDFLPRLSPDGKVLYFGSSRPTLDSKAHGLRIWKVEKTEGGWGEPAPLPAPINAPDGRWNWGASVTRDGTIYFASNRDPSGRLQIYRSRRIQRGVYEEPEKLGPEINSEFNDYEPYVNGDESLLFFASAGEGGPPFQRRPDTLVGGGFPYARGDIYVSRRVNGKWTQAQHLEHGVNSFADEGAPALTPGWKASALCERAQPVCDSDAEAYRHGGVRTAGALDVERPREYLFDTGASVGCGFERETETGAAVNGPNSGLAIGTLTLALLGGVALAPNRDSVARNSEGANPGALRHAEAALDTEDSIPAPEMIGEGVISTDDDELGGGVCKIASCARMAELADALDSGSSGLTALEVRVLFRAPLNRFDNSPKQIRRR